VNHHLAGVGIALAAAALYALAVGLQAIEARQAPPEDTLRLALLRRLVKRPLWVAGAATGVLGWVLQALALTFAPLTLVEPTLAASLVFLLLLGTRLTGERAGRVEALGVLFVAAGLAGLGWAAPAHSPRHTGGPGFVLVLALLAVAVAAPHLSPRRQRSPLLIAASAGVAYAFAGLGTKFATDDVHGSSWLGAGTWLVTLAAVSAVGQLNEMSALQLRPVTRVAPVVFSLNVLVPVALAPALAHEPWGSSAGVRVVLVLSLVAVACGMVVLSRSRAVGAVLTSDQAHAHGLTTLGRVDRPPRAIPTGVPETSE
jgi:drug/metabolite transporter (DMT)-like permease